MIRNKALLSLAAWAATVGAARAGMIFERTVLIDRPNNHFSSDAFDLDLTFSDALISPTVESTLFDDVVVTPGDVDSTFTANLANDELFSDVAARIANGLNDAIRIDMSDTASDHEEGRGWLERGFFKVDDPTFPPDLAGYIVESISMTIDGFRLDSGSSATTTSQPVELFVTVAFEGQAIPEPQTWALAGCGVVAMGTLLAASQRRRRRQPPCDHAM